MIIERIVVKKLGPIRDLDWERPDWVKHFLVRGLLGKTTLLDALEGIWDDFYQNLQGLPGPLSPGADFGILLSGLPGPASKLWLWNSSSKEPEDAEVISLLRREDQHHSAKVVREFWDELRESYLLELTANPEGSRVVAPPPKIRTLPPFRTWKVPDLDPKFSERLGWYIARRWGTPQEDGTLLCNDGEVVNPTSSSYALTLGLMATAAGTNPGDINLVDGLFDTLHLSDQRPVAAMASKLIAELGGSLVVSSNAPEVWDQFRSGSVELYRG